MYQPLLINCHVPACIVLLMLQVFSRNILDNLGTHHALLQLTLAKFQPIAVLLADRPEAARDIMIAICYVTGSLKASAAATARAILAQPHLQIQGNIIPGLLAAMEAYLEAIMRHCTQHPLTSACMALVAGPARAPARSTSYCDYIVSNLGSLPRSTLKLYSVTAQPVAKFSLWAWLTAMAGAVCTALSLRRVYMRVFLAVGSVCFAIHMLAPSTLPTISACLAQAKSSLWLQIQPMLPSSRVALAIGVLSGSGSLLWWHLKVLDAVHHASIAVDAFCTAAWWWFEDLHRVEQK